MMTSKTFPFELIRNFRKSENLVFIGNSLEGNLSIESYLQQSIAKEIYKNITIEDMPRVSSIIYKSSLAETAQWLEEISSRDFLLSVVKKYLSSFYSEIAPIYFQIRMLPIQSIISSSISSNIKAIYKNPIDEKDTIPVYLHSNLNDNISLSSPFLIQLFGDKTNLDSLIVTQKDIIDLLDQEGILFNNISNLISQSNMILFIGYDITDFYFLKIYATFAESFSISNVPVYVIASNISNMETVYWKERGINLVSTDDFGGLEKTLSLLYEKTILQSYPVKYLNSFKQSPVDLLSHDRRGIVLSALDKQLENRKNANNSDNVFLPNISSFIPTRLKEIKHGNFADESTSPISLKHLPPPEDFEIVDNNDILKTWNDLSSSKCVFIVGLAGSGKTTLLREFFSFHRNNILDESDPALFYVILNAKHISNDDTSTLIEYVAQLYSDLLPNQSKDIIETAVMDSLLDSKSIICIEDIDLLSPIEGSRLKEKIKNILKDCPKIHFIITTRYLEVLENDKWFDLLEGKIYNIENPTLSDKRFFISSRIPYTDNATSFIQLYLSHSSVHDLVLFQSDKHHNRTFLKPYEFNSLWRLQLLFAYYEKYQTLPSDEIDFMSGVIRSYLGAISVDDINIYSEPSAYILGDISYNIKTGNYLPSRKNLVNLVKTSLSKSSFYKGYDTFSEEHSSLILDSFLEKGILFENVNNCFAFSMRVWADFFATWYLHRAKKDFLIAAFRETHKFFSFKNIWEKWIEINYSNDDIVKNVKSNIEKEANSLLSEPFFIHEKTIPDNILSEIEYDRKKKLFFISWLKSKEHSSDQILRISEHILNSDKKRHIMDGSRVPSDLLFSIIQKLEHIILSGSEDAVFAFSLKNSWQAPKNLIETLEKKLSPFVEINLTSPYLFSGVSENNASSFYHGKYEIGKYPVTEELYEVFNARNLYNKDFSHQDHPVNYITWYDAFVCSYWLRATLPSILDWEIAAYYSKKDEVLYRYPWGYDWDFAKCNTKEYSIDYQNTTAVTTFEQISKSPFGCVDMVGNVYEWTSSYDGNFSNTFFAKGGSWQSARDQVESSKHLLLDANYKSLAIGFRLCRGHLKKVIM